MFGANAKFTGVQFHFHAGSEHTIDNKRYDLEMHTVHTADTVVNGIGFAAMGLMFSVEDYNTDLSWSQKKIVDTFFDTLKWGEDGDAVTADLVTYGDLMNMANFNKRWIYKGSVTTPPCATYVYWNVLSTVYPISQKHLDLFKTQLAKGEEGNLVNFGNYREV